MMNKLKNSLIIAVVAIMVSGVAHYASTVSPKRIYTLDTKPQKDLIYASDAKPQKDLSYASDAKLQKDLESLLRREGLWRAVQRGELSLLVAIVTDSAAPRMAEVNAHNMMYAASLPKIAILLGAAVAIQEGRLNLDDTLRKDIIDMIRYSCNPCATRVLELVGREELIDMLQSPDYDFYDNTGEGGLWVGKDYAPGQAYHRDPLFNLSHGATAFQVARFYYRLNAGTLVSPEYSNLMLEALSKPGVNHKFVKGMEGVPGLKLHRKSGTWKTYHSDSMLVYSPDQAYIIVGLVNNENGGKWLTQLAKPLNQLVNSYKKPKSDTASPAGHGQQPASRKTTVWQAPVRASAGSTDVYA